MKSLDRFYQIPDAKHMLGICFDQSLLCLGFRGLGYLCPPVLLCIASTHSFSLRPTLLLAFSFSQQMTYDSGVCSILGCSLQLGLHLHSFRQYLLCRYSTTYCHSWETSAMWITLPGLHSAGMKPGPLRP